MVCVGLSERALIFGVPGKILGGSGPPWHPPISAPGSDHNIVTTEAKKQNCWGEALTNWLPRMSVETCFASVVR